MASSCCQSDGCKDVQFHVGIAGETAKRGKFLFNSKRLLTVVMVDWFMMAFS